MKFQKEFFIGSRTIGAGRAVFIIAEGGISHFGKMDLAKKLVRAAAKANVDAFKLQVFNVDELFGKTAKAWKKRLEARSLQVKQLIDLAKMVQDYGMEFILTFHDESHLHLIDKTNLSAIKVGSGEKNNPNFVKKLSQYGKPIILSTGMYMEKDIHEMRTALQMAGNSRLALLHCNTAYPTPDNDVNLKAINHLRKIHEGPIGYSDHTVDSLAILGAVAFGSNIIEKHLTILRDVPNAQDWKVSCDPEQLKILVKNIRRLEKQLGDETKKITRSETDATNWALKSLVASVDLKAGTALTENNCKAKRPGGGLSPADLSRWVGKKTKRYITEGQTLYPSDLK